MLDLHLYQFTYTTDSDQPYYLGITFNNSEVVVGFAPGDVGDTAAFQVTDKFNGKQLACININHRNLVTVWHDIVTKAHHLVLDLHAKAVAQAQRDREWSKLMSQIEERMENIRHYLDQGLLDARAVRQMDIQRLRDVFRFLEQADGELDLLCDPEEDENED